MDYFYCSPENISSDAVLIDGEEFAHLVHVMRKKIGDEIRVVDGLGTAYDVTLVEMKKREAKGKITSRFENYNEPSVLLTLAVGILKNPSRFDFLVEKVTELGAKEIIPITTERTIPSHAKTDRWQKLALAAMKQCGRGYLPHVRSLLALEEVLKESSTFKHKLIAHETSSSSIGEYRSKFKPNESILVLIGPEGGFSEEEIQRCTDAGFTHISLGTRRLRTETAAITATSFIVS